MERDEEVVLAEGKMNKTCRELLSVWNCNRSVNCKQIISTVSDKEPAILLS